MNNASKLRTVVASAMNKKAINKKANNLVADNYSLQNNQISVYSVADLAKEKYPDTIEGYVAESWGIITWVVDVSWTGTGFRFMPRVLNIEISMRATINRGEDKDFEDVELSFPVDMDKIEIEIEDNGKGGCYLDLSNIEVNCDSGQIKVIFVK